MRLGILSVVLALCFCTPVLMGQSDHIEVGVFADYFNLSRTSPHINYVGLGARAAFNVQSHVQIEAEMSYDFEREFHECLLGWNQYPVRKKPCAPVACVF